MGYVHQDIRVVLEECKNAPSEEELNTSIARLSSEHGVDFICLGGSMLRKNELYGLMDFNKYKPYQTNVRKRGYKETEKEYLAISLNDLIKLYDHVNYTKIREKRENITYLLVSKNIKCVDERRASKAKLKDENGSEIHYFDEKYFPKGLTVGTDWIAIETKPILDKLFKTVLTWEKLFRESYGKRNISKIGDNSYKIQVTDSVENVKVFSTYFYINKSVSKETILNDIKYIEKAFSTQGLVVEHYIDLYDSDNENREARSALLNSDPCKNIIVKEIVMLSKKVSEIVNIISDLNQEASCIYVNDSGYNSQDNYHDILTYMCSYLNVEGVKEKDRLKRLQFAE